MPTVHRVSPRSIGSGRVGDRDVAALEYREGAAANHAVDVHAQGQAVPGLVARQLLDPGDGGVLLRNEMDDKKDRCDGRGPIALEGVEEALHDRVTLRVELHDLAHGRVAREVGVVEAAGAGAVGASFRGPTSPCPLADNNA